MAYKIKVRKELLLTLVFILSLNIVSASFLQFQTDRDTDECIDGEWDNIGGGVDGCANFFDNNTATAILRATLSTTPRYINITYNKPVNETANPVSANWTIYAVYSDGLPSDIRNITLTQSCMDYSPTEIKLRVVANQKFVSVPYNRSSIWECFNGTGFEELYRTQEGESTNSEIIFEESITWLMDEIPNITLVQPLDNANISIEEEFLLDTETGVITSQIQKFIFFQCYGSDDVAVEEVTLIINNEEITTENLTNPDNITLLSASALFNQAGTFIWNCRATDTSNQSVYGENRTFTTIIIPHPRREIYQTFDSSGRGIGIFLENFFEGVAPFILIIALIGLIIYIAVTIMRVAHDKIKGIPKS